MTIDESMAQVAEVADRPALLAFLRERFDFWNPTDENVTSKYHGYDSRISWVTYLICIDGKAALIADRSFTLYQALRGPPASTAPGSPGREHGSAASDVRNGMSPATRFNTD